MRNGFAIGVALALALLAGPRVYAFQEQTTGARSPPAQAEQPAPRLSRPPTKTPRPLRRDAAKPDTGTEIRIPGLGKLGVLPKMDFGLELLYGAAEQKPAGVPEGMPNNPDED